MGRRRNTRPVEAVLAGAAAGAAGTTALNLVTYLDMAIRGRPASRTPEETVERMLAAARVRLPGGPERRPNRVTGIGAALGMATGVAVGALAGAARDAGVRLPLPAGTAAITGVVLLAANGPMTVLGVTDPRTWSRADWLSDVVPHLAYGLVTSAVVQRLLPDAPRG